MSNKQLGSPWHGIFGRPPVLDGEDVAAYDELCGRLYAAVEPADVIDEMYLDDIATLEWEVLRWRRLKSSIIGMVRAKTLKDFLTKNLSDDHYRKKFEEALVKILQENLEEGQTREDAQRLARHCANNSSDSVEAVNDILTRANLHIDELRGEARAEQAEEIVQDFLRHVPSAVRSVDRLLAEAAVSIDDLIVEELGFEIGTLERIDRLTTIAETRRNTSLREIDRRRATLGEGLRRGVQEIEHDELKMIEAIPPKETKQSDQ
jgi:hypothetical protein